MAAVVVAASPCEKEESCSWRDEEKGRLAILIDLPLALHWQWGYPPFLSCQLQWCA